MTLVVATMRTSEDIGEKVLGGLDHSTGGDLETAVPFCSLSVRCCRQGGRVVTLR